MHTYNQQHYFSWQQLRYGFALMELIVVLALLGIFVGLVTIGVPDIFAGYRLRGATQELLIDLQRARMSALTENNRYLVFLDDDTHYTILDDNNNNNAEDVGAEQSVTRNLTTTYHGVRVTADGDATFLPDGGLSSVTPITFTLTNATGHTHSIVVSPTGRVRISN